MERKILLMLLAAAMLLATGALSVNLLRLTDKTDESSSVIESESKSSMETESGESVELPADAVVPVGETLHAFWYAADIPGVSSGFWPRIENLEADMELTIPFEDTTENAKYIVRFCVSDCEKVSENGTLTYAGTNLTYTRVTDVDTFGNSFVSEYTVTSKGASYDDLSYVSGQTIDLDWVMITRVTE